MAKIAHRARRGHLLPSLKAGGAMVLVWPMARKKND
jgi:hypothetical protein